MAMVHDEYGHLEGVVTPADLLMALVGTFASHQDEGDAPQLVERADGSLLVAGSLPADVLGERLAIELPENREFATAAGYRPVGAQAVAAGRRDLRDPGLALRSGRHGRAAGSTNCWCSALTTHDPANEI